HSFPDDLMMQMCMWHDFVWATDRLVAVGFGCIGSHIRQVTILPLHRGAAPRVYEPAMYALADSVVAVYDRQRGECDLVVSDLNFERKLRIRLTGIDCAVPWEC